NPKTRKYMYEIERGKGEWIDAP
ncbi:hypothetical protein LCGC14_2476640, partial [marine sediment metagenome]